MGFLLINSPKALRNVARNMLRPGYLPEMCRKVATRFNERQAMQVRDQAILWCKQHESDGEAWAMALDPALWAEAQSMRIEQEQVNRDRVESLGFPLAGGGFYPMLYFITRKFKPDHVLETGVAAGHSSRAFLKAMDVNQSGHLWSSDFPLFRLDNPDKYIGVMVEETLRGRWTVLTAGDRQNIPALLAQMLRVDLFHFDSDKSHSGRDFAWSQVQSKLHAKSIIMFDDVQDNFHFRDIVAKQNGIWKVFAFEGKWVGIILPN